MEICAIVSKCVQIGPDDYIIKRMSRIFSTDRNISDIMKWAESLGLKNVTINDIQLADHTGSSI